MGCSERWFQCQRDSSSFAFTGHLQEALVDPNAPFKLLLMKRLCKSNGVEFGDNFTVLTSNRGMVNNNLEHL